MTYTEQNVKVTYRIAYGDERFVHVLTQWNRIFQMGSVQCRTFIVRSTQSDFEFSRTHFCTSKIFSFSQIKKIFSFYIFKQFYFKTKPILWPTRSPISSWTLGTTNSLVIKRTHFPYQPKSQEKLVAISF